MNESLKKKEVWIGVAVIAILIIIGFTVRGDRQEDSSLLEDDLAPREEDTLTEDLSGRVVLDQGTMFDVRNMTYSVGGESFTVEDGTVAVPVEGSSALHRLSVLESPAFADVNGDGNRDAVVLLRSEPGGSGIFYYTTAVLAEGDSRTATNEVFLGDRIRIKSISVDQGIITITVLTRGEGEPMSAQPTQEEIRRFIVTGSTLTELL